MNATPESGEDTGRFIDLGGTFYQTFLARLHAILKPATYFEIGTLNGDTLKLASCASISVDPHYQIESNVFGTKPALHFFQVGSDEFFATRDPVAILGRPIDLAFLDGMHLFEFLLRDFANTEKHCRRDSVIVLHDCLPGDEFIAVRSPDDPRRNRSTHPGYWTGDVWKMIPALRQWRPDLRVVVVDAPPTGLVLITNLDPGSDVLQRNYGAILDGFLHLDLGRYGVARLHNESAAASTEALQSQEDLAPFFTPDVARAREEEEGFTYDSPLALPAGGGRSVAVEGAGQDRARPGPSFHDDPDGAGVFGQLGPAVVPHAPAFVVTAPDLRQVGFRSFLTEDGALFTDEALVEGEEAAFLDRFGQQDRFLNEETGLRRVGDRRFRLDGERPVRLLAGDTVSLCSFEPTNHGAFLFRVLPKLAGRPDLLRARAVLAPLYHDVMRDLYGMAGLSADRIIPHDALCRYRFERAVVPSLRNPHALLDAESLAFYADLRQRFGSRGGPRRIFVSRLGWTESYASTQRVMENERQLAERLQGAGFAIVKPHELTARQQVEAFSSADLVVGAAGSAMFNTVFCHPGTRVVDIESEPHWIFAHSNLFGSCGLDYGIFEGKTRDRDWSVAHKPFSVNIDALMARIRQP